MLDPISSAVSGFVRGVVSSVASLFKDRKHDDTRKARLRAMLGDPRFKFGRNLPQLAAGIGADPETTKRLLLEIGARPSETDADLWTLKSPPSRKRMH